MKVVSVFGEIDLPELHLMQGLKREGVELTVLCSKKALRQERLSEAGIEVQQIEFGSKVSVLAIFELRKIFAKQRPDIIYCLSARALSNVIFALGSSKNRPRVIAYRGAIGHISKLAPTSWISYLHPNVDAISCVSQAVYNSLCKVGVPERKLRTIYKGHDSAWYSERQLTITRQGLKIPDSAMVVGCVANMRQSKGVDRLFEVIREVSDVHFILVGEMEVPLEIQKKSNVSVLGSNKDAKAIMKLFDVIILPSRSEGLPRTLLEAMNQGVAPIVTQAGGMPEVVRNGIDGLVVPIDDIKAMVGAIEQFSNNTDLLESCKISAKKRVIESFNIKDTISQTLELYHSVLS